MFDFTLKVYCTLIKSFLEQNYSFYTMEQYVSKTMDKYNTQSFILIRHDVDLNPCNALKMAEIEREIGLYGTYYFRIAPQSFNERVINRIAEIGHEIGYHYEDVDLAGKGLRSGTGRITDKQLLIDLSLKSFLNNLAMFRKIYPVKTICMHGSPMSKYDNRLLWTKYNYRDYGIIGEPYFDVNFSEVAYYTDTGRCWNGDRVSVRDKVGEHKNPEFKSTKDIIEAIRAEIFPQKAMLTIHPQRWHDRVLPWGRELLWQNLKNVVKWALVRSRNT